jgi:cyclopropane fatty-acyl-phospholipid synthase-like methyltransferase
MATREEAERQATYDVRYRDDLLNAGLQVEREAVGTDYGNNGFSTVAQADELLRALAIGPGDLLLDVGSGAGWPGLYLAMQSGCRVVVSDLTVPGMRRAGQRATDDGIAGRTTTVVASARHLPFKPDSFDAMVHTDVLC